MQAAILNRHRTRCSSAVNDASVCFVFEKTCEVAIGRRASKSALNHFYASLPLSSSTYSQARWSQTSGRGDQPNCHVILADGFADVEHLRALSAMVVPIATKAAIAASIAGVCVPNTAQAQVDRSVENASFEANDPPGDPSFRIYADSDVPGWQADSGWIEVWDTNFNGVPSQQGLRHAEINANSPSTLYQQMCLLNGEALRWSFYHRARAGGAATQTANFEIANQAGIPVQSLGVSSLTDTSRWYLVSAPVGQVFNQPSGVYRMQFRTTASGSVGNFIDNVNFGILPFVELMASTSMGRENTSSADALTLLVSGVVTTAFNVQVQVTGGTATLGTDYTTPSGTGTFSVTIPAGTYSQQAFPVGITLIDDALGEANETIELSVVPNASFFIPSSTSTCGAAPISTATHTITHAADLSITKSNGVSQVFSGTATTYTLTVSNVAGDEFLGAIVTDSPGAGLTCDAADPVTITGDGVPAGSFTIADLLGGGIPLATLASGQTATLSYSCQVN